MQQPLEVGITQHLDNNNKSSIRTHFILYSIPLDSLMSGFLDLIGFEKKFPLSMKGLNDIRVLEKPTTLITMPLLQRKNESFLVPGFTWCFSVISIGTGRSWLNIDFLLIGFIAEICSTSDILLTICASTLFGDLTSIFIWHKKTSNGKAELELRAPWIAQS